jgi:hypothetical protein
MPMKSSICSQALPPNDHIPAPFYTPLALPEYVHGFGIHFHRIFTAVSLSYSSSSSSIFLSDDDDDDDDDGNISRDPTPSYPQLPLPHTPALLTSLLPRSCFHPLHIELTQCHQNRASNQPSSTSNPETTKKNPPSRNPFLASLQKNLNQIPSERDPLMYESNPK